MSAGTAPAVVEGAKRPRGLLADTGLAILERLDERRDGALIVERAERPRGVAAGRPRRAAQRAEHRLKGAGADRDERRRGLLPGAREIVRLAAPPAPAADRRLDRRRISQQADERLDRRERPRRRSRAARTRRARAPSGRRPRDP